ncbi:MAG: DUF1800 domain-containing protein, partial [Candidatus Obscuribacterales bacterium]|nr:DUF1800 domain-containing protein [Candidatus Obscuribacterales bacterium]
MSIKLKALFFLLVFASSSANLVYPAQVESLERDRARHMLNRIAYGPRPQDIDRVLQFGIDKYIEQQLDPQSIPEPEALKKIVADSPALTRTPAQLFLQYGRQAVMAANGMPKRRGKTKAGTPAPAFSKETIKEREELQKQMRENSKLMYKQVTEARLMRAVYSPRQLEEVMTDFWFNHFNVSFDKGLDRLWIGAYEQTAIRPYALSKFNDLLLATSHHAAMLFYLDNWQNTSDSASKRGRFAGLNENYARELMELHTMGVDGGYTQKDVVALARILTGHGLQSRQSLLRTGVGAESRSGYYFDARRHDFSDKVFLGRTIKGEGEKEIQKALAILARHPATARHISFKLAQYFVADNPPEALVERLATSYKQSDGDIKAMLRVILKSEQFWDSKNTGGKYKTPYRYLISSLRATNASISRST